MVHYREIIRDSTALASPRKQIAEFVPPPSGTRRTPDSNAAQQGSFHITGQVSSRTDSDSLRRTRSGVENYHTINILKKPYEEIRLKYLLGKEIGRGQYGVIRMCVDRSTGEIFACKIISKNTLTRSQDVEDVQQEVRIMETLKGHHSIIELIETIEDFKAVYLIMEMCGGGELYDRITQKKRYSEPEAAQICHNLLSVIEKFRSKGIVHRDLKPENILLSTHQSDTQIKVIDFGLACFLHQGSRLQSLSGSAYYLAPEVLKQDYGIEVDMWSVGVILYILLRGIPPFWHETEDGIFKAIRAGKYDLSHGPWKNISKEAKDLVRKMLTMEPSLRINPKEALEHPWFKMHTRSTDTEDLDSSVPLAEAISDDNQDIATAFPVDEAFPSSKCSKHSQPSLAHARHQLRFDHPKVNSLDEIQFGSLRVGGGLAYQKRVKPELNILPSTSHAPHAVDSPQSWRSGMGLSEPQFLSTSDGSGDYSFSPLGSNSRLDSGDLAFLSESIMSFKLR